LSKDIAAGKLIKVGILIVALMLIFIIHATGKFLFYDKIIIEPLSLKIFAVLLLFAVLLQFFKDIGKIKFAYVLFILAFASRLAVALWAEQEAVSDFKDMLIAAQAMQGGNFLVLTKWDYFLNWAYQSMFVVYQAIILFISPDGFEVEVLIALNAAFMAGVNVLIYLFAKRIFNERTAKFTATLYLFYPAPVFLAPVLTNQHISLFALLLGFYILFDAKNNLTLIISGIICAIGQAMRPDATLLIFALIAVQLYCFLFEGEKSKSDDSEHNSFNKINVSDKLKSKNNFVIFFVTYFAVGWLLSFAFSASGLNPNGLSNKNPLWRLVVGLNVDTKGMYSAELDKEVFGIQDETERNQRQIEIIKRHLSLEKDAFKTFLTQKTEIFWRDFETIDWGFRRVVSENEIVFGTEISKLLYNFQQAERLYFLLVSVFALFGILSLLFYKKLSSVLLASGIMFSLFFIAHLFIEIQSRYRYIIYPFLFLLMGSGIDLCLKPFINKKTD